MAPTEPSRFSQAAAVKRACDACHRRKVKCDGVNPCRNCSSAQLSCTYNAIPQKKGPKGSRAKVISELRETQRQTNLVTKVQNRLNGTASPPASPAPAPSRGLLTKDVVVACVDFYLAHMFSTIPILHRNQLEHDLATWETNPEIYCLVTSLCAFMMLQPGMPLPGGDPYGIESQPGASIISARLLMEETMRVRRAYDHLEKPTINTVCTSYFLFATHYGLEEHDRAWYHLRDASTTVIMYGMNKDDSYLGLDNANAARWRRIYWLLYITERAYSMQRGHPLSLQATIKPPTMADDPMDPFATQLGSFLVLINTFTHFDDQFANLWVKIKHNCSSSYLDTLQKQFSEVLPAYRSSPDSQLADGRHNQAWLKQTVWQLSMTRTQHSNDVAFPVDMQQKLMELTSAFSTQSMDLISGCFVEKLLETASSLVDILSVLPGSQNPFSPYNPRESLQQVHNLVGVIRNGESRFLPLLFRKMNEVMPRLVSPMLQNMPESLCSVDIFDGFGNGGMAQPTSMGLEDYDYKFSVPEIKTEPGLSPPGMDMTSPFVSSPPGISPAVEYPRGLSQDFSSMTEMVMSPVGPGPQLNSPGMGHHNPAQSQHHMQQHQQHIPQQQNHQQQQQHLPHHPPPQQQQQQPNLTTIQAMGHNMSAHYQNSLHPGVNQPPNIGNVGGSQHALPPQMNGGMGQQNFGQMMPGGSGMMMRPQQQRSNSFAVPTPTAAHLRTVGDFQALQRTNSDMSAMPGSMGGGMVAEIDFNTLSR